MWVVVYLALNLTEAWVVRDRLSAEGVLVRLRITGSDVGDGHSVEVLVPEAEVAEAMEVLNTF